MRCLLLAYGTAELATSGTGNGQAGMNVGEESRGILFDLAQVEPIARVDPVGDDARLERTPQATDAVSTPLGDLDRVGEGNPRGTGLALWSLMDVRGRGSWRLVLALKSVDGDVEADDVLVDVDAVEEQAGAAFKPTRRLVVRVDDFIRRGDNLVCRGELERATDGMVAGSAWLEVTGRVSDRRSLGQSDGREDCEEFHGGVDIFS